MRRLLFWGLFSVTLAVYGVMLVWSLPLVTIAAGGLQPFDMRPWGYSFAEAEAFLSALSEDGRHFYLQVQQRLDMAYPALVSVTLFLAIAATLPRGLGKWRWVIAAPALPIALFDYLENIAVAAMLVAGPRQLTPDMAAAASRWTILKSGLSTMAMVTLLCLLARRARHWSAQRWRAKP